MRRSLSGVILLVVSVFAAGIGTAEPSVRYDVDLTEPQRQLVRITMRVDGLEPGTHEVFLPVWRPGRYGVLDFAATLRGASAATLDGGPMDLERTGKSSWTVDTGDESGFAFSYTIYANSMGNRTRYMDDSHAFLSGSSVFVYTPEARSAPVEVGIRKPETWRVATGLEPSPTTRGALVAANYDVLVDSPIEVGEHDLIEFEVEGVPHEIVIWGEADYDPAELEADFAAIVREQLEIFERLPYERYVFMIHVYPGGGGGTEHLNSTIMQTSRERLEDEDRYEGFLGLVSHEMFHTWNVKSFRPAGITPYDYQRENMTDLLWVAEGTTSYYDDLTLVRAGLIDVDTFLGRLEGNITGTRRVPGKRIQSLAESSQTAWIHLFGNHRPADAPNTTVNFYGRGALLSMLLDLTIRDNTNRRHSLDDVMREMYEAFDWRERGYTHAEFEAVTDRAGRGSYGHLFDAHARGTGDMPLEAALLTVGLVLEADEEDEPEAYVGLRIRDEGGRAIVTTVYDDGPGGAAGFVPGDEILAIGARRVGGSIGEALERHAPGETVGFLVSRFGHIRSFDVPLIATPYEDWELSHVEDPTRAQREGYEAWIGQPWPEDDDVDDGDDD